MGGERIPYRKLPGHRRGIINVSSVWLGPDHLLLVKSHRFKEEYKRYYLRDIQAIAIARTSRFHLSSRSLVLGFLWMLVLSMSTAYSALVPWVWGVALLLVFVWFNISISRSCVCRIYTAVSSDPLPSVYRTWTARRFLAAVEPRIREVQGEIDPAWREAAEQQRVGPELEGFTGPEAAPSVLSILDSTAETESPSPLSPPATTGAMRTPASDIFLATLLFGAVADAAALAADRPALVWVVTLLTVLQSAAAVFIFIDRNRGRLRSDIHIIAIIKLMWLTLLFYIDTGVNAVAKNTGSPLVPANETLRGVDLAVSLILLLAGLWLSWRSEAEPPHGLLGN
jgi:hypothetical protein